MSRLDKQQHQEHVVGTDRDTTVRLFAFSNARPRYQVVFAPEEPLIILKSKKSATPQHPCLQWEPLSSVIFHAHPNTTHAVYVADTTEMSSVPMHDQEEHVNGAAVGPLLKRLGNTLLRLNPHNATMVAAGVSAHLGLKFVLVGEKTLGHRDRLVQRLVLVCPAPLTALVALTNAVVKRPAAEGYALPELVVLLKDTREVPAWSQWLHALQDSHKRIASFRIVTDLQPSLFAAVAREAGMATPDGTTVDALQRHPVPRVYRIDFVLSKQTKTVIQLPRLSPLSTMGYDEEESDGEAAVTRDSPSEGEEEREVDDDVDCHEDTAEVAAVVDTGKRTMAVIPAQSSHVDCDTGCDVDCGHESHDHHDHCGCDDEHCGEGGAEEEGGSVLVSGLQELAHWRRPVRVIIEGRVLDLAAGRIGTTEGCVMVRNLKSMAEADVTLAAFIARFKPAPPTSNGASKPQMPVAVAIAAVLERDKEGYTTLRAEEVRPLTKAEVRHSMTAGATLGELPVHYNTSSIAHSCGVVLIRGRKCALVRDVDAALADPYMRLPVAPHSSANESQMDCAVRALCEACDVSSDNFYLPSYLPPVMYYDTTDSVQRCVTVYTALAISPPPRGPSSDAIEDVPEPNEPYDWVSLDRALLLLATEAEKEALREVHRHLAMAQGTGFYTPLRGCGLFGDAVRPIPGVTIASKNSAVVLAPAALSKEANRFTGVEFLVVACPGDVAQKLLPSAQRSMQTRSILVCTEETTTAEMAAAASAAYTRGEPRVLLYLDGDMDTEAFCEAHLLDLTEETQATAQVFTALLPHVAATVLGLSDNDDVADSAEEAEALLESLLSAVRVSDALVATAPPSNMSAEEAAVLKVCCRANPDLVLSHSWDARAPFSEADLVSCATPVGATLKELAVCVPAGTPVAPAALAYLTHAGALDCFFAVGRCRLLFAQGEVWVPTRGSMQAFVYLDISSRCLTVEPGSEWEGEEHGTASNAKRPSMLTLLVWCADAAAVATVTADAARMAEQLAWHEDRDGSSHEAAHDPLPKWK